MPTAARLVGAVFYAILGYMLAESYRLLLPPGTSIGMVSQGSAAIGLLCGWFIAGGLAGRGYARSPGMGIRTALTIVFWALLLFSTYQMIINSTRGRYDGSPMEAITGALALFMENGALMLSQQFAILLLGGGALGGVLTEIAKRNLR
ncbi:TrgA family protein [Neogemmobacter tilapiae]|uniref:Tellurium resistance protein n=1 Tax=Neogemmobacter tilapiae TaxID=875041 RepID=A0A918TWI5_9RHOB|nr:TrgA family protein [Gemmobacter tilapiae]GHC62041.1 tellurium resistance protein [Gemmobacter tilapiae]